MRVKRLSTGPMVLLLLMAAAVGGSCDRHDSKTISIGLLSVFSGNGAEYGETAKTGVELAVATINRSGGINGKLINIVYEDDRGQGKDAVSGFRKLATIDKVPVVIGPFYSNQVLACAPEADKYQTVLMTGSATSDNIRKSGQYVFRTCPVNAEQGRTIALFCRQQLQQKTAFIIYRNADYGVTLKNSFTAQFSQNGGMVTGEMAIDPEAKDARPQLLRAKESKAAIIFIPVHYPEGGVILKQAKELGINAVFIGGDGGFDPELVTIAGNAADSSYWATIGWGGQGTKDSTEQFMVAYREKFHRDPGVYSGLYYDAMMVVAQAMKIIRGDITGAAVREALYTIKDYKGPTGVIPSFHEGDVDKPFSIFRIINGKFEPFNY